jgi:hypothetical protein
VRSRNPTKPLTIQSQPMRLRSKLQTFGRQHAAPFLNSNVNSTNDALARTKVAPYLSLSIGGTTPTDTLPNETSFVSLYNKAFLLHDCKMNSVELTMPETMAILVFNFGLCCHMVSMHSGCSKQLLYAGNLYHHALELLSLVEIPSERQIDHLDQKSSAVDTLESTSESTAVGQPEFQSSLVNVLQMVLFHNLSCVEEFFCNFAEANLLQKNMVHTFRLMARKEMMLLKDGETICPAMLLNPSDVEFITECIVFATTLKSSQLAPAA